MTKDVIELAREAGLSHRNVHSGLEHCNLDDDEDLTPALVKYAALVAARERERVTSAAMESASKAIDAAVSLTIERCAQVGMRVATNGIQVSAAIRAINTEGEGNDPITG